VDIGVVDPVTMRHDGFDLPTSTSRPA